MQFFITIFISINFGSLFKQIQQKGHTKWLLCAIYITEISCLYVIHLGNVQPAHS